MREWFKLPDEIWNSPVIRNRLAQEAALDNPGNKNYYHFIVPIRGGIHDIKNYKPSQFDIEPDPFQMLYASDLMQALNKFLHHDGYWIVGWTCPPGMGNMVSMMPDTVWGRMVLIWMDGDGDIAFAIEFQRLVHDMLADPYTYYVEQAEKGWQEWAAAFSKKVMKDDLGLSDDQIKHAALESLH